MGQTEKKPEPAPADFTLDERTADIETFKVDEMSDHERAAFVIGFFSGYSLHEIDSEHRELFEWALANAAEAD